MSFYPGAGRHDALEAVVKAATLGDVIAVIAPKGGGVSTLLGLAAVRLVDYGTVIRMDGAEMESLEGFLQALMARFDVPEEGVLAAFEEAAVHAPVILIADSAHVISTEVLNYVAELKRILGSAFAVVFGGRPRFLENLPMPTWEHTQYIKLAPFSPSQSVVFVETALPIELGSTDVVSLVRREFSWPGELLLQYSAADQEAVKKPQKFPWWHIIAALVLLLLLLFVWALKNETSEQVTKSIALPPNKVELAVTPTTKEAELTAEVKKPARAQQVGSNSADSTALKTERWLRQQAADTFMMQLMLATTEAQAKEAVAKLSEFSASYYRARRNNRDVYIVLIGPFAAAQDGQQALQKLPADLRGKGAFPRSTKQVQQELSR